MFLPVSGSGGNCMMIPRDVAKQAPDVIAVNFPDSQAGKGCQQFFMRVCQSFKGPAGPGY
jgi:hypothetical protein